MEQGAFNHKYLEVYNAIHNDIILGVYPAGAMLPAEARLMEIYGVSRNTVRHAMELLRTNGLIASRRGSGATVLEQAQPSGGKPTDATQFGQSFGIQYFIDAEAVTYTAAATERVLTPPEVAEAFGVAPGSPTCLMQRIWSINGHPYIYMKEYINTRIFPESCLSSELPASEKYHILRRQLGLHILDGQEVIRCKNADFIEANLLNIAPGTAIFRIVRTVSCEEGIFEYTELMQNSDYAGYSVNLSEGFGIPAAE